MGDMFYVVEVFYKGGSSIATITLLEESPGPILILPSQKQMQIYYNKQ